MSGFLQSVRAETRKLLSIRSTYILVGVSLALVILFALWIQGFRSPTEVLADPSFLNRLVVNGIGFIAIFPAVAITLLITHEYRYNTVLYSMTSSPSRERILAAKIVVSSLFMLIVTGFLALLVPFLAIVGAHLAGHDLAPQSLPFASLIWRVLFYGWGTGMAALLIGALVRSQIAAVVALFVIPSFIEQILTLLLKKSAVYLPFTALGQVLNNAPNSNGGHLSYGKAAYVFIVYLVVGWIVAFVLLQRRNAN